MRVIPSVVVRGKFVDFEDLSRAQQERALKLRPKWKVDELARFRFWVKPNGEVSGRKGHHELTAAAIAELSGQLSGVDQQAVIEADDRGDLRRHRVTRFSVNKEPV